MNESERRAASTPRDWKPTAPPDKAAWKDYREAGLDESGVPNPGDNDKEDDP